MPAAEQQVTRAPIERRRLTRSAAGRLTRRAVRPHVTPVLEALPDWELPLDPAVLLSVAAPAPPAIDLGLVNALLIGALAVACAAVVVLDTVLLAIYL